MYAVRNVNSLMPAKNPRINVVIPAKLKREFEQLCVIENRSMSNMLVTLAQRAVDDAKRKGLIKDSVPQEGDL